MANKTTSSKTFSFPERQNQPGLVRNNSASTNKNVEDKPITLVENSLRYNQVTRLIEYFKD